MNIKIKKTIKFLSHDIWHIKIEDEVSSLKTFFIAELQILLLEFKLFFRNNTLTKASSLAFTTLLSLIPVMAIMFMFFKMFGGELVESKIKPMVYEFLASGSGDKISSYIDAFLSSATVDALGSIGFIFLLIAIYSILSSIELNFNDIWNVKKARNALEQLKTYLALIFITPILVVISLWLTSRIEIIIKNNLWNGFSVFMISVAPFILILLVFIVIIKIMPNCRVNTSKALVGGLYGTTLYYISKYIFVYYTKVAVSYNVIYGSIAVLPFLMLWIYFLWIIILFSVQVTFVRQNIHSLKYIERGIETNRFDRIRIALLVSFKLINSFIHHTPKMSIQEMSDNLNLPLKDVRECLTDFEKSGIVVEIAGKQDTYTPNIPLKDFTVKKLLHSVDKMYIPSNNYETSEISHLFSKLFKNDEFVAEIELEKPLEEMLYKNK